MNAPLILMFLSLATELAPEPAASPPIEAEAPAAIHTVQLEVDHSPLLGKQMKAAAEKSGLFVHEDVTRALREQHGVEVVEDRSAPSIVVTLAWEDYENSVYRIEIGTRRPGKDLKVAQSFEATCINNSALTKVVVSKLPVALDQLEAPEPAVSEPEPVPAPKVDEHEPRVQPPDDLARDEAKHPLGKLGRTGIAVGSVGIGALIAGAIVYGRGRRPDHLPGTLEDRQGRDFGPPGIAVMVSGGAALAAGVALLIVDRARARKPATALLLPSAGGFVLTGRF